MTLYHHLLTSFLLVKYVLQLSPEGLYFLLSEECKYREQTQTPYHFENNSNNNQSTRFIPNPQTERNKTLC